MAAPGLETIACKEGERMGNNGTSFAIVGGGSGDRSIKASQGRRRSIAARGCGVQRAGTIEQQQRAPPDGGGDNSGICQGGTLRSRPG